MISSRVGVGGGSGGGSGGSSSSASGASILDRPLHRSRHYEVSLSAFALLFAELVHYTHNRVQSVAELQSRLAQLGAAVGVRLLELVTARERQQKRDTKILGVLMFIKGPFWRAAFGREADKLEHAQDDDSVYYIIEKDPLVNTFISVPRDKGSLNCAAFVAGMVQAVLCAANFPAKVSAHWHKGTTYMVKFDSSVLTRDAHTDTR